MKPRTIMWVCHVVHIRGSERDKLQNQGADGIILKLILTKIRWKGMDWSNLAHARDLLQAAVTSATDLQIP
jgi:hypothetical protein